MGSPEMCMRGFSFFWMGTDVWNASISQYGGDMTFLVCWTANGAFVKLLASSQVFPEGIRVKGPESLVCNAFFNGRLVHC